MRRIFARAVSIVITAALLLPSLSHAGHNLNHNATLLRD